MVSEGIYSKPATGTGAGTRKDSNWDTAYGWGDHSTVGYLTSFTETYTEHENISAASSSNNSGRTYIQDILLDSNGHVTGITTASETVTNTDEFTTGATFNTGNGVITFTRNDGDTYTVDIDGRYMEFETNGNTSDVNNVTRTIFSANNTNGSTSNRPVNYSTVYKKPAPFDFVVSNNLSVRKGSSFTLTVDIQGNTTPSTLIVNSPQSFNSNESLFINILDIKNTSTQPVSMHKYIIIAPFYIYI